MTTRPGWAEGEGVRGAPALVSLSTHTHARAFPSPSFSRREKKKKKTHGGSGRGCPRCGRTARSRPPSRSCRGPPRRAPRFVVGVAWEGGRGRGSTLRSRKHTPERGQELAGTNKQQTSELFFVSLSRRAAPLLSTSPPRKMQPRRPSRSPPRGRGRSRSRSRSPPRPPPQHRGGGGWEGGDRGGGGRYRNDDDGGAGRSAYRGGDDRHRPRSRSPPWGGWGRDDPRDRQRGYGGGGGGGRDYGGGDRRRWDERDRGWRDAPYAPRPAGPSAAERFGNAGRTAAPAEPGVGVAGTAGVSLIGVGANLDGGGALAALTLALPPMSSRPPHNITPPLSLSSLSPWTTFSPARPPPPPPPRRPSPSS